MARAVKFRVRDGVAVVTLDHQPANVMDSAMRAGLAAIFDRLPEGGDIAAVVIVANGAMFSAGLDMSGWAKGRSNPPSLAGICRQIEGCAVPVVVGIHGEALAGGAELALAAHYRVGDKTALIGLPYISLGLIPNAGGTQRLPRLIGATGALKMLMSGQPVSAGLAHRKGLLDAIVEAPVSDGAFAFAKALLDAGKGPRPTSQRRDHMSDGRAYLATCKDARIGLEAIHRYAAHRIVDCVEGAVLLPFVTGLAQEADAFESCHIHPQSVALRHVFLAEQHAGPEFLKRKGLGFKVVDPAGKAILRRLRPVWNNAAQALLRDDLGEDDIDRIMVDYGFRKGPFGLREGGGPIADKVWVRQALIAALMAEGARMMEDGTARCAADVDAIAVHGMSFPRRRGGPMRAAQSIGLLGLCRKTAHLGQDDATWQMPALVHEAIKYADGFDALAAQAASLE